MAIFSDMAGRLLRWQAGWSRPRRADQAQTADTEAGPVDVNVYRPKGTNDQAPVYLHFPDGGFIGRGGGRSDASCHHLADTLGAVVLLADPGGAPGQRFPLLPARAQAVVWWAMLAGRKQGWDGKRLVLGGTGAGANLALGACLELPARMAVRPLAVVARTPVLDLERTPVSWRERIALAAYLPDRLARRAPLATPLAAPAGSLDGFPPTLMVLGRDDPRRGEGEAFAAMLSAAGRDVRVTYPENAARAEPDAVLPFLRAVLSPAAS